MKRKRHIHKSLWAAAVLAGLLLTGCGQAAPVVTTDENPGLEVLTQDPGLAITEASRPAVPGTALPPAPESTASPVPSAVPTPTATLPPVLRQLTSGECCVQPFWSADSSQIWFLDKPDADSQTGLWAVSLEGGEPFLARTRLGVYSPDQQLMAYPEGGQTIVERAADGQRWVIPSQGRAVSFSPDNAFVAWTAGQSGPPFDTAVREVWISRVDGSEARLVQRVIGGGFSGWLPGGGILFSGKLKAEEEQTGYFRATPEGEVIELVRAERLRGASSSPGGSWLAYQVAFAAEPDANGMWLVNLHTLERVKLPVYGAFRWRSDDSLLIIPLDPGQASHRLWEYRAGENSLAPLTDPAVTFFKVANGDWTVSPDGHFIAFLSAGDFNIWVLELP